MSGRGNMDWIDRWCEYNDGIPSPFVFRLWSGIATLAALMERRVWIETARTPIFPNLYTMLVSRPGIGKSAALATVKKLWLDTKHIKVAPDNVTKASLVDELERAKFKKAMNSTQLLEFSALATVSSEFGVLVPAHDLEFLNVLNHIYDNPDRYRESRRSLENQINITQPMLNIIAGTQPAFLASLLPEEAWGMGFTSRLMLIYSGESVTVDLFDKISPRTELWNGLVRDAKRLCSLYGKVEFSLAAQALIRSIYTQGIPPIPTHSKLENYLPRRILHWLKLSMVAWAATGAEGEITETHVATALAWLLSAEEIMPDIFKDMAGKSDAMLLAELHHTLWAQYVRQKKPVSIQRITHILAAKVPVERVDRVISVAVRANILKETSPGFFEPVPQHEHGEFIRSI